MDHVLLLVLALVCANAIRTIAGDCTAKSNCTGCLQEIGCVWHFDETTAECLPFDERTTNDRNFYYHRANIEQTTYDDGTQFYNISTGLARPVEFTFKFVPSHYYKFPLDIYYLMDVSNSMRATRDKLVEHIESTTMHLNAKSDLRFGFGTFIEKRTMPFVNFQPQLLQSPCKGCVPAYSFKNHVSLGKDVELFKSNIASVNTSGNLDRPENGLDAMVQAIVCEKEIGWRNRSRRVIALLTDNDYHVAGDGRLGGIVVPNDLRCHLDGNEHTTDTIYDYPSVGQIIDIVERYHINPLFIVADKTKDGQNLRKYRKLSGMFKTGSTADAESNFAQIVTQYYENITDSFSFESHTDHPSDVDVNFSIRNCGDRPQCDKSINETVEVRVTLRPRRCIRTNVTINPVSLPRIITIELRVECDCNDCATIENAAYCSGKGDSRCGSCACKEDYSGTLCQCDDRAVRDYLDHRCVDAEGDEPTECHDKGTCNCGRCICNEGYYGVYCECKENSCEWIDGRMCSGRGQCNCGRCNCNENYNGTNCECPIGTTSCVKPDANGLLCSGHGDCVCGRCVCSEPKYEGDYCETCDRCQLERCEAVADSIVDGETNVAECVPPMAAELFQCPDFTHENCAKRVYMNGSEPVCVGSDCKSTTKAAMIYGSLTCIATLLSILLAALCWKYAVYRQDKREYEKFVEEKKDVRWNTGMSPLFRDPVTKTVNPLYKRE